MDGNLILTLTLTQPPTPTPTPTLDGKRANNINIGFTLTPTPAPTLTLTLTLDGKRANNINIGLAQFKAFYRPLAATSVDGMPQAGGAGGGGGGLDSSSWRTLCIAVMDQDEAELNLDRVDALRELMPTTEETRKIYKLTADVQTLGRAEQFVVGVSMVPRFSSRLDMFAFKLGLSGLAKSIQSSAVVITEAAEQVMSSKGLALVLRQVGVGVGVGVCCVCMSALLTGYRCFLNWKS